MGLCKTLVLVFLLFCASKAQAYEVNIYDAQSDSTKVVVEYCDDRGHCSRLITNRLTLETDYATISMWLDSVSGND